MIGLDTNVLVRYITQDDPRQAAVAARVIESECTADNPGFVSLVALIELVWVLEECYRAPKTDVVAVLQRMLRAKQLVVQGAEEAWKALRVFEASKADFADCVVERLGTAHGCEYTATFDRNAARAGMRLLA